MKNTIKDMKALVSRFQEETKSNSVLDFTVWFENLVEKAIQDEELNKKKKCIRKDILTFEQIRVRQINDFSHQIKNAIERMIEAGNHPNKIIISNKYENTIIKTLYGLPVIYGEAEKWMVSSREADEDSDY